MKIMYDNIVIAEERKDETDKTVFTLDKSLPDFFRPNGLFKNGKREVTLDELKEWASERVPPKNRGDIKRILKEIGLKRYDAWQLALNTRASLMGDGFWLKVNDTDTFRENTIRGRAGEPEIDLNEYK